VASETADTAAGTPALETDLPWADCEGGTECADVEVPADPADPEGGTLVVHVRRLLPRGNVRQALWFVDGGPGDGGTRVVPDLGFFQDLFPKMAIYAVDQRGAGASSRLVCPDQESETSEGGAEIVDSEWADCAAWAQAEVDLAQYSTARSAADLGLLIELLTPEVDVTVWGVSYGTWLTQHYLAQFPTQADAVLLDGLVPGDWTFAEFDGAMDGAGRDYLKLCDADEACASRLGGDAVGFAERVLVDLERGPCAGVDADLARQILGALLLIGDDRAAMPATLYRLDRCSAADTAALGVLVDQLPDEGDQSQVLLAHIVATELWPADGPSSLAAKAALEDTVVATGAGAWLAARAEAWTAPRAEPFVTAPLERPGLLLHGGLDPTVSLERALDLAAAWPAAGLVKPPGAGHVALNFSDCAGQAYLSFLENPASPPFSDCSAEPFTEGFDLSTANAQRLFGTEDAWD
jgi:pimeloyl-ACP methyl ester carboxylesterase